MDVVQVNLCRREAMALRTAIAAWEHHVWEPAADDGSVTAEQQATHDLLVVLRARVFRTQRRQPHVQE